MSCVNLTALWMFCTPRSRRYIPIGYRYEGIYVYTYTLRESERVGGVVMFSVPWSLGIQCSVQAWKGHILLLTNTKNKIPCTCTHVYIYYLILHDLRVGAGPLDHVTT